MSTVTAVLRRHSVALAAGVFVAAAILGPAPAASAATAKAAGPLQALPAGFNQTPADDAVSITVPAGKSTVLVDP